MWEIFSRGAAESTRARVPGYRFLAARRAGERSDQPRWVGAGGLYAYGVLQSWLRAGVAPFGSVGFLVKRCVPYRIAAQTPSGQHLAGAVRSPLFVPCRFNN